MYAKFTCQKCGHTLFVSDRDKGAIPIGKLSEVFDMACPICGEDNRHNWYLSGVTAQFKEEAD